MSILIYNEPKHFWCWQLSPLLRHKDAKEGGGDPPSPRLRTSSAGADYVRRRRRTKDGGRPVTGAELVGRETEINEIIRTLNAGQSVVLIAPRRFGKTSVMLEVLDRLDNAGFWELSGKGYIYSRDSSYFLTDPLFEKFIKVKILKLNE